MRNEIGSEYLYDEDWYDEDWWEQSESDNDRSGKGLPRSRSYDALVKREIEEQKRKHFETNLSKNPEFLKALKSSFKK
jgi:hypothetical protein